jgi:DNA-directed RNA polymerase sigma subunit (sigma70/sigma32)
VLFAFMFTPARCATTSTARWWQPARRGVTFSAMSRALGISRQRVQQIFERLDR